MCLSAEVELFNRYPLELIRSGKLIIRTKSGELKPLIPNPAQNLLLAKVQKCLDEKRPVRIRILKARQLGFSTLIEAIIYAFTSRREGFNSLVIADDDDGSAKLFAMNKLFHEKLAPEFRPDLKKSNEIALEFSGLNSRIDIDTSRNKNAGRGDTYQIIHKSESSRFAYPKEVNLGIANAVPDLPSTMIFDESTANGMNHFQEDWDKSVAHKDGYESLFVPWYMDENYSMPVYGEFVRDDEERDLAAQALKDYGMTLTDAQLLWRRYAIPHKCGGDRSLFKQEYPATPEESFLASGRPRFDIQLLQDLKRHSYSPSKWGMLDVFSFVDPAANYVIGVDTSEGLENGDESVVSIINCKTFKEDAIYAGKLPPDILADYIKTWADTYNKALVVIEDNNHGLVTINAIKGQYQNLYYRKVKDEQSDGVTEKLGWRTTLRSKPLLIGNLDKALRSGLVLRHADTISQFMSYVINEDGSTSASQGKKDDRVMATACAIQGFLESKAERELPPEGPHRKSYNWWERMARERKFNG